MRIIVVGGTGTIGKAVVAELSLRHEVVIAGHTHGEKKIDITSKQSINDFYQAVGKFDALIATTGTVIFANLINMDADKYLVGLNSKLMGQVNLVLLGLNYIHDNGSFTLTSGILSHDPIVTGSSASMVNGALESFVKAAAIELPRSIRINCVSPTVITESLPNYAPYFRGFRSVSAATAAKAYSKSVEGRQTGQIYEVNF